MYTRGPSIARIFQKAMLLKDTKCNKIIQRTMCSHSLIKFSKIEKLKPMKRYFSGASNNRNPNQRNRSIQGVGYIRKALPQFPREMVQQQQQQQQPLSMKEQMTSEEIACSNLGMSAIGNAPKDNGKITVVLDKNEICGCSAPNESIQIYVTTAPEKIRTAQELSNADTAFCSTKCKCCQQCLEVNNSGIQKKFLMKPNVTAFQQPSNTMNFPNYFPIRRQNVNSLAFPGPGQNVYGLPKWNLSALNGGRPLNVRKNRSVSEIPVIRKSIGLSQSKRSEGPEVNHSPIQQTRLRKPDRPVDILERDRHTKRIDWLKRQERKYSSFDRNVIPEKSSFNKPNAKESKQPDTRQRPFKWNFNVLNDGRMLTLRKNRSMSDFPAMRKLIVPNSFNQIQPHTHQLPMKMHSSPIYQAHSINSMNRSGNFNNNQPPAFQRTMIPNLLQIRRRFSVLGQPSINEIPKVNSSPIQQSRSSGITLRPDQHTRSRPVDVLDKGRYTRTIDELNDQEPKYKSIYRNFIPDNIPFNQPETKQSKQPRDEKELGRSGPRMNQTSHQSRFIVERVIRPATFSSVGRVLNKTDSIASALNEIAVTQKIKSLPGINQKRSAVNSSNAPFIRKPDPFNLQEIIAKKKFPDGRATVPRMLTFQNRNVFTGARQRADNVSNVGLRRRITSPGVGPIGNPRQANVFSKNNFSNQSFSISSKQRSTESISRRNSLINPRMVNLKQLSVQRQPQLVVAKKRSSIQPSFNQNHQIKNFQPPNVSYKQRSNIQLHFGRPVQMRANHMNHFGQLKQPPKFLLNKRGMPVMNLRRQKTRQLHGKRRRSFIPISQKGNLQRPVSDFRNRTGPSTISMIPVRNRVSQLSAGSLQRIPIQPFQRSLVRLTQTKRFPTPDSTKQKKSIGTHQRLKRDLVQKMNNDRIQASLPNNVRSQTNQIEKYVGRPKSLEAAGQMNTNQRGINPLRLQQMLPLRQTAVIMPQKLSIQAETAKRPYNRRTTNPLRLQKMQPLHQTADPMAQDIQPNALKPISSQSPTYASNLKINNPAVLFYAPGKLKLIDYPMPRLTDEKGVIVKILYVHLTDTDAHMLSAEQDGPYKLTQPTIAGKSGSGVIVDAGKKVENVKIGDKVSVKGLSCGKCTACENDNEVMCERISITEKLGILKRFHAVPAKFVTKLPDAVHPIDGAMIDELSSAIRACKKSTVTAGDNVLVLGGKSLGLWTTLAAKSMGATNVCLADSRAMVLEQGKKLGIEQVYLIDPKSPIASTAKSIAECMKGENPRIVFDCNGSPLTNEIAMNTSMIGGKIVLMKNAISNQPTFLANAVDRGIDILSSQHGNDDSERAALQFLSSGKVQLKGIDSSFFNITNVHEAFGLLTSGTTANVFIQPSRPDDESDAKK